MEATFNNPYGISTKEWNYELAFHADGSASDVVVLTSAGQWYHRAHHGANWDTGDEGTFAASLLDTHAYSSNTLRLTVKDNTGIFYADGTKIVDIRVSSSPRGSGLGVSTCIFIEGCIRPATVAATDFKASPL